MITRFENIFCRPLSVMCVWLYINAGIPKATQRKMALLHSLAWRGMVEPIILYSSLILSQQLSTAKAAMFTGHVLNKANEVPGRTSIKWEDACVDFIFN